MTVICQNKATQILSLQTQLTITEIRRISDASCCDDIRSMHNITTYSLRETIHITLKRKS